LLCGFPQHLLWRDFSHGNSAERSSLRIAGLNGSNGRFLYHFGSIWIHVERLWSCVEQFWVIPSEISAYENVSNYWPNVPTVSFPSGLYRCTFFTLYRIASQFSSKLNLIFTFTSNQKYCRSVFKMTICFRVDCLWNRVGQRHWDGG